MTAVEGARMRCNYFSLWIITFIIGSPKSTYAYVPPAPEPLKSRIWLSTHIFVGAPAKIDLADERGNAISPGLFSAQLQEIKNSTKGKRPGQISFEKLFPEIHFNYYLNVSRMLFPANINAKKSLLFRESFIFAPYGIPRADTSVNE